MARVDKTNSAVGVVRAVLLADLDVDTIDTVVGVGLNASGQVLMGADGATSQTGFVGVMVPTKFLSKAGQQVDIFKLGDIVDIDGLDAGTNYWLDEDGALTATEADGLAYAGYTVEADRLVLSGFGGGSNVAEGGLTGNAVAAPDAAAVPFADLTAAANAYNAMRTALIERGVFTA